MKKFIQKLSFSAILTLLIAPILGVATLGVAAIFAFSFLLSFLPGIPGATMASIITTSVTWTGKQNVDVFIKPLFIGENPLTQVGIRVIPNVQSTLKLNYFGSFKNVLKAYSKGFSAASGGTFTQRDLTVYRLKGEFSQDAQEFYQTVFETALNKGVEWNDISGTMLEGIIINLFIDAIQRDIFRQFWLADEDKETVTGSPLIYTGTADTNYNMFDGMWKIIFDNAATTPTSTQIKKFAFSHGSVAQVDTVTLTGTSGTCNVTFNGVAYLATFATSLTVTTAAFVTSHAAALLLRGVVVTSSTDTIIFTSSIAGQPFTAVTISAAVTGDLTGTRAATTANTAPSDLATDEAYTMLMNMFDNSPRVLTSMKTNEKRFLVTDDVYTNYLETLETLGTEAANKMLVNGVTKLMFRGIVVESMGWGEYLDADFPTGYPSRIIYTADNNLAVGIDTKDEFSKTEFWYNKDEQENRYRTQFKMGVQYTHNELFSVAF